MHKEHIFQSSVDPDTASHHCYDVLVVGAGPAGSSAAYHLACQGIDVLLVDRFTFPRDKRCGDAIMPLALEELAIMGIADEIQSRFNMVQDTSACYYGMPGIIRGIDASEHFNTGYVAPRISFDALLCEHALRAGASWLDQVTIYIIEEGQSDVVNVRGIYKNSPFRIQARIVIAADGSGSRLARQLRKSLIARTCITPLTGPEVRKTRFTAMRGYYTNLEPLNNARNILEFFVNIDPGTYYYWIFPLNNGLANIGVIADMAQLREHHTDLAQALVNFLQGVYVNARALQASLQGQLEAAPISAGMRGTALYGDHLLCIGDAAALAHPLTAEGISGALASGRLAAETAINALKLNSYTMETLSPYGITLRKRYETLYNHFLLPF